MKKIALHGSYFGDNFGDTLFVEFFIKWLEEHEKKENLEIFLPFAGNRIREYYKDSISDAKGLRALWDAQKVVFLGGGYLGEPPKNKLKWNIRYVIRHLLIMYICILFKKPFIFIGVGAGPLTNNFVKRMTVFACNQSCGVVVRDTESRNFLVENGVSEKKVTVSVDSILEMSNEDVNNYEKAKIMKQYNLKENNSFVVGLHLPVINIKDKTRLNNLFYDLDVYLKTITDKKITLIFFIDFYKEKYEYYSLEQGKHFFQKSNYNILYHKYESPKNLIALIDCLDILFTSKLHCGIVANCLNKYTVSFSTHTKIIRLYKQLGISERCKNFDSYKKGDLPVLLSEFNLKDNEGEAIVDSKVKTLANNNKNILYRFIDESGPNA